MQDTYQNPSTPRFKIIFAGECSAGKTSIVMQYAYNKFEINYLGTVGIDFVSHFLNVDGTFLRLQIWDTAGQERFKCLVPSYMRGANACILVYDVSNKKSFTEIPRWFEMTEREAPDSLVCLVANKVDLEESRQVSMQEGQNLAEKLNIMYMEVSAKSGFQIGKLFSSLGRRLLEDKDAPCDDFISVELNSVVSTDDYVEKNSCLC